MSNAKVWKWTSAKSQCFIMFHHSLHISPYLSVKNIRIAIWSIWGCFLVSPMFGQSNMQIPNSCCGSKILKQILVVWLLNPIFTGIVIPNRKINWIGKWNKFPSRNLWSLFHRRSSNRFCCCDFACSFACVLFRQTEDAADSPHEPRVAQDPSGVLIHG